MDGIFSFYLLHRKKRSSQNERRIKTFNKKKSEKFSFRVIVKKFEARATQKGKINGRKISERKFVCSRMAFCQIKLRSSSIRGERTFWFPLFIIFSWSTCEMIFRLHNFQGLLSYRFQKSFERTNALVLCLSRLLCSMAGCCFGCDSLSVTSRTRLLSLNAVGLVEFLVGDLDEAENRESDEQKLIEPSTDALATSNAFTSTTIGLVLKPFERLLVTVDLIL